MHLIGTLPPLLAGAAVAVMLHGCGQQGQQRSMEVTATAYTMSEAETKQGNPGLAAWGDKLAPGTKAIAVSRDLVTAGLTHGTNVTIEGLDGVYVVRDKMNKRWREKIDIFMGKDREAATRWGKKTVVISWYEPE